MKKKIEEQQLGGNAAALALLTHLKRAHIDPQAFIELLSRDTDRHLKARFGVTFLVFTFLITAASYAIVICDGVFRWNIAPVAITALIIETPIQFVGLLYIIARNLFPTQNITEIITPSAISSTTPR